MRRVRCNTDYRNRQFGRETGMSEITRRTLLRHAAVAGAAASLGPAPLALAKGARGSRKRVAVLGGGMAGLTAAHELAERGFQVTVYERNALGGKARSIPVA